MSVCRRVVWERAGQHTRQQNLLRGAAQRQKAPVPSRALIFSLSAASLPFSWGSSIIPAMAKREKLSTESYKGVRDFYPEDQFIQRYIFEHMERVCELFGYEEYNA